MAAMLVLVSLSAFATPASAQLLPEVTLECQDSVDLDVSPGSSRMVIVSCELENPSLYEEEVELMYEFGELAGSGPDSLTVPAGETSLFTVTVRADADQEAEDYLVNITAEVTSASGIPGGGIGSDSDEVTVTVPEFTTCENAVGQGGGTYEAGQKVSFSASITCESNTDSTTSYSALLISDSGSSAWPSGFEDQSPQCEVLVPDGGTTENCQFLIATPSNLEYIWEGCVILLEVGGSVPQSCPSTNAIDIKVEPKTLGIGSIELTGNDSVFGNYSDEAPIIIGGVVTVLVLAIIGMLVARRRRRSG